MICERSREFGISYVIVLQMFSLRFSYNSLLMLSQIGLRVSPSYLSLVLLTFQRRSAIFSLNFSIVFESDCYFDYIIQLKLMVSVEIMLIILAVVSLPNLFYRAQFNIPILLYAAAVWQKRISSCAHLIVLSWAVELYRLIFLLVTDDKDFQAQKKPFLLVSTILAFVLKCVLIVYLVVSNVQFKRAVSIPGWLTSIGKGIKGEQ